MNILSKSEAWFDIIESYEFKIRINELRKKGIYMAKSVVLDVGIQNGVIVITDDSTASSGDTEKTHAKDQDKFKWQVDPNYPVKSFDIDFGQYSPFKSGILKLHGDSKKPTPTETIDPTRAPHDYKYTVSAVPKSGSPPPPLDPHIIVDDGGLMDDPLTLELVGGGAVKSIADVLLQYKDVLAPDGKRFFFPFGIQSIQVGVTVDPIGANVTVSGETPV